MPVPWLAIACALSVLIAREARAEWPCADHTRHRVARSAKGNKPIGIAAANDKLVYGTLAFVELDRDGKQDLVFASACIRGPADSVRFHRVYASCGAAADGVEEFVLLFEEEELCTRTVKIEAQAGQTTVKGVAWQDLQLVRTIDTRASSPAGSPAARAGDTRASSPAGSPAARAGDTRASSPAARCEQTTQALQFDGAQYRAGPRTSRPCPKP